MKKSWIVLINFSIMLAVLAFVIFYARHEGQAAFDERLENFTDMTVAMERVTENYLEGEQNICDVWARHIAASGMTLEQAQQFVRSSHVLPDAYAHLIYTDDGSLSGLSTRPRAGTDGDFAVSYAELGLFPDDSSIDSAPGTINITRSFVNPMNGVPSIAFYDSVSFRDAEDGSARGGLLLRVVPISKMAEKWVFPQEEFQNAEFAMIDAEGGYIIKGQAFPGDSFFDSAAQVQGETGVLTLRGAEGEDYLLAYTPILSTDGWMLLSCLPLSDLSAATVDWLLVGVVAAALLLLFVVDLIYMMHFNRRLQMAAEEARTANRAKTDFLSTMSHDIRTPMNAIIGLTTIAEKNLDDKEAVGESLRKISLASNHLLTLINDILDISKVESGKLTLKPLTFSLVETAENLVNLSQPMVKEKNIDFSFRCGRIETEYLHADQLRLNQICINILSNAIKYTEPGGSVSVELHEEQSEKPGCVRLIYSVADTGIGMSEEFMARMYQPFSRQTDSRVNLIQGTGLGLAITKQMVTLMDGSIDCVSAPGKGTTFTVALDIPKAERRPEDMQLGAIDVLLVDDDVITLETAQETLRSLGANAETAESASEALGRIIRRNQEGRDYSVVILDWKMPEMDGVELVRRIRSEIGSGVPILLISAYDWSDIEDEAKSAGANGFISKPLFRSTLHEKISALLGRKSGAAAQEEDNAALAGMRVLVAEDNDINWEIVYMLLSMYGVETTRAENGQICVDMLRDAGPERWDLVFMDIQMPVMNGLDATRAIRALPDKGVASIPIIAMTADAFSENVAACLDAGMNGHIAKPIDVKLVLREIGRIREEKQK